MRSEMFWSWLWSSRRGPARLYRLLMMAAFAVTLVACTDPSPDDPEDAAFVSMDAMAAHKSATEVSATIGSEGGTLRIMEGPAKGATLVVPPGALSTTVTLTMRVKDPSKTLPALPKGNVRT